MTELITYRGRAITSEDILSIRELIAAHPGESRRTLSTKLCEAWQWRQANGALRDIFGANEKLTRCARIELTPLETVLWTGDNANAHHHPRRQARWSRRVVGGGKIIHAKGVPRFRLPLAAQAR
jgi:hypothetical protein